MTINVQSSLKFPTEGFHSLDVLSSPIYWLPPHKVPIQNIVRGYYQIR